jgi:hypothetical protein
MFVIQDIQFALTYQKCLRITFAPFDERLRQWWATKAVLSDGDWTNRAIWLLAETIDFCYNISGRSHDGRLGSDGETALRRRILDWELGRPDSFAPLHLSAPDPGRGKPFPVAWYTSLCHGRFLRLVWFGLINVDFSKPLPFSKFVWPRRSCLFGSWSFTIGACCIWSSLCN